MIKDMMLDFVGYIGIFVFLCIYLNNKHIMKEYIEDKLNTIEQDILKERNHYKLSSLLDDRNVILYLLSFFI